MTENDQNITTLSEKLDAILKRQQGFSREIDELRFEIFRLKTSQVKQQLEKETEFRGEQLITEGDDQIEKVLIPPIPLSNPETFTVDQRIFSKSGAPDPPKSKSDIEKFIGENLINKIGIVITVIGVAVGAKYSIEHDLISPLTRILLGYLMGFGLLGLGIKLKKSYTDFSAVLVSGAIAILYFMTFAAYSFYGLIPRVVTFMMMVVFTVFTVLTAIRYNRQVIAHIGLVGAYAVPFLLSQGSGNVTILFSYMSIINIGILFLAIKKYWKSLYYSSFLLTWCIFIAWYAARYQVNEHYGVFWIFLLIHFATFYLIFVVYKLRHQEKFGTEDILLILANAFIFYGLGYSVLNDGVEGKQLLGLFTVMNAMIHFLIGVVIYQQRLADRNLFYLIVGLGLVFITMAVPVQLDGNWVTLLWAGEAAILFWIGRKRGVSFYERVSYALMFLALGSLVADWLLITNQYSPGLPETRLMPIFNVQFLTSALFIAAFVFINYVNNYSSPITSQYLRKSVNSFIFFSIPAILLVVLYVSLRMEIATYWNQMYLDSATVLYEGDQPYTSWNEDLKRWKSIWIINFSLIFFAGLSFLSIKWLRNRSLATVSIMLSVICVVAFLTHGLFVLSILLHSNSAGLIDETLPKRIHIIRYISLAILGITLLAIHRHIQHDLLDPVKEKLKVGFDVLLHTSVLWVISSELIVWIGSVDTTQSYKLGLSILWGVYALLLIVLGIWKDKRHLRIGAILLFAVTLIKLFFYDISYLDTIAKTIVFVSLGLILLIISFLYNKYKHLIST